MLITIAIATAFVYIFIRNFASTVYVTAKYGEDMVNSDLHDAIALRWTRNVFVFCVIIAILIGLRIGQFLGGWELVRATMDGLSYLFVAFVKVMF